MVSEVVTNLLLSLKKLEWSCCLSINRTTVYII